jgi:hypothetical protein
MSFEGLRKEFPPEQIGKLPAVYRDGKLKRPALDYVGHAAVTDRLNQEAPNWTYTIDHTFTHDESVYLRGTMTIDGISRVEFGAGDDPKKAISDFIKRGAMRFGVALDLWSKEELLGSGGAVAEMGKDGAASSEQSSPPPSSKTGTTVGPAGGGDSRGAVATDPVGHAGYDGIAKPPPDLPLENRRMAAGKYKGYWYSLMAKKEAAHFLNADDEELGGDFHALAVEWVKLENPEAAELIK